MYRWVLYLATGRQVLYQVGKGRASPVWHGEGTVPQERPEAWQAKRLAVIVDLMEEEYRFEHLPHLTGADRRSLWSRKQRQLFRGEPYVSVKVLGREKAGRRDDLVLFTAIREAGPFRQWMETLAQWQIAVSGVWSLPQLCAEWKIQPLSEGMRLMIYPCGNKLALRQCFHRNKRLVFSRLSLIAEDSVQVEGPQELERTWRYLMRLLGLDPVETIALQLWVSTGRLEVARGLSRELPNFSMESVQLEDVATEFGWKGDLQSLEIPALTAFSLARRKWLGGPHYRDTTFESLKQSRWLKTGLYLGAAGLVGISVGYDSLMEHHAIQLQQEMRRLQQQKQGLSARLTAMHMPERIADLDPWQLQSLVELKQQVDASRVQPAPLLDLLSSALERFPALELEAVQWRRLPPEEGDESSEASIVLSKPIEMIARIKTPVSKVGLRAAVAKVERFAALLAEHKQVSRARLVGSTIPFREDEPVRGEMGTLENVTDSATFTVEIQFSSPGDGMIGQ